MLTKALIVDELVAIDVTSTTTAGEAQHTCVASDSSCVPGVASLSLSTLVWVLA